MLFIFVRCRKSSGEHYFGRTSEEMKIKNFIAIAAALCFAVVSFGCGGAATNTTSNTTANKPANTTTTTTTTTTNTAPANTSAANSEMKADASEPGTGVAECDEYIKKYEACLTTIASKAPQAAPGLKSSFEAQRNAFKSAASTPQGKATLPATCKQAVETAKSATSQWCTW
jgi:hypothetical protein